MGDVIHLKKGFGFELEKKRYIYLYFMPSHLCITLPSCCRNVIYDKVTGEANSAWKAAKLTESKTETKKKTDLGLKTGFLGGDGN